MRKDLKKLRQTRNEKAAKGKTAVAEFNTLAAKETRTPEEDARMVAIDGELNALEAEVEALDAEIATEEKVARRSALFTSTSVVAATIAANLSARTIEPNPETTFGFKSMSHFAHSVLKGEVESVMNEASAPATYNRNSGANGEGFLVPPEYSKEIWSLAFADNDLLGMVNPEPTSSNAVAKPKDESTPWGAVGVQAYWRDEAADMTASAFKVSAELMTLHELYAFTAASNEVLSDAPMLENRLTFQAGRAIGWKASDSIMWGSGAGQPWGFMGSKAKVMVAKDAGQAAATLSIANLANMLARVLRFGARPLWIANQDIIPQLVQLTYPNGFPAFMPINQGVQASPFDGYLLGYPIMFSEHAQTLGTEGDLTLVNLSGYYAATKAQGGIDFAASMHLFFAQNLGAFRWTFRLAGLPILSAPVNPARGATTRSHFVTLQSR